MLNIHWSMIYLQKNTYIKIVQLDEFSQTEIPPAHETGIQINKQDIRKSSHASFQSLTSFPYLQE